LEFEENLDFGFKAFAVRVKVLDFDRTKRIRVKVDGTVNITVTPLTNALLSGEVGDRFARRENEIGVGILGGHDRDGKGKWRGGRDLAEIEEGEGGELERRRRKGGEIGKKNMEGGRMTE
jgi:hypothetical protein